MSLKIKQPMLCQSSGTGSNKLIPLKAGPEMMNVRDEQTALALRFHGMVGWLESLSIMLSGWTRSEYTE